MDPRLDWPTGIKPEGAVVEMVAIISSPASRLETSTLTPIKVIVSSLAFGVPEVSMVIGILIVI